MTHPADAIEIDYTLTRVRAYLDRLDLPRGVNARAVLLCVAAYGPTTAADVGRTLRLSDATVTDYLRRWEDDGAVTRDVSSEGSGRSARRSWWEVNQDLLGRSNDD